MPPRRRGRKRKATGPPEPSTTMVALPVPGGQSMRPRKPTEEELKMQRDKWWRQFPKRIGPGDKGFNSAVAKIMFERGIYLGSRGKLRTQCDSAPGVGFAHQETAAWLVGPETPINRLLVVHRTGSGKTNVMIKILDKYFFDPRPKIVIFPNSELVANFYGKFFKTKTAYTDFARYTAQRDHKPLTMEYFKSKMAMEGELHRRNTTEDYLASPVRPIQYSIAAGSQVLGKGRPNLAIFRAEYSGDNPYDNKIVIMDEVHNLVHPPPDADRRLAKKLIKLRAALAGAKNCVIVGLTATPLVVGTEDGDELVKMIKGDEYKHTRTSEGFISYFNALPPSIYPTPIPGPGSIKMVSVPLAGDNLVKYQAKTKNDNMAKLGDKKKTTERLFNLMNYCAMAGYYPQANQAKFYNQLRADTKSMATKLDVLATDAIKYPHKCAILIHRRVGFDALKRILQSRPGGDKFAFMGKPKSKKEQQHNPILDEFNDNKANGKGQKIKCLVLDAKFYGEGIDLIGVRQLFLAHPAPNYASYKQWVGRVFRSCAYTYLPRGQRNVSVTMYISRIAKADRTKEGELTADEIMLRLLTEETQKMEKAMKTTFGLPAADRRALNHP